MLSMTRADLDTRPRPPFANLLRELRSQRRLSQLGLAMESDVAQRHISFLESGRARPGREVVLKLATGMDLSLRATNGLLHAAGFAADVEESPLSAPALSVAREAIDLLLTRIEPCPAILVDSDWNVHGNNAGAQRLMMAIASPQGIARATGDKGFNLVTLLRDDDALLAPMPERDQVIAYMLGSKSLFSAANDEGPNLPFVPATFRTPDRTLSFLTILAGLNTPRDVTLQELKVEIFFPADDVTKAWAAEADRTAQ